MEIQGKEKGICWENQLAKHKRDAAKITHIKQVEITKGIWKCPWK